MSEHTNTNEACDRCEGKGLVLAAAPYSTGFRKAHGPWRACPDCAMTKHTDTNERLTPVPSTITDPRGKLIYRTAWDRSEADTVERIAAWLETPVTWTTTPPLDIPTHTERIMRTTLDMTADMIRRGDWKDNR